MVLHLVSEFILVIDGLHRLVGHLVQRVDADRPVHLQRLLVVVKKESADEAPAGVLLFRGSVDRELQLREDHGFSGCLGGESGHGDVGPEYAVPKVYIFIKGSDGLSEQKRFAASVVRGSVLLEIIRYFGRELRHEFQHSLKLGRVKAAGRLVPVDELVAAEFQSLIEHVFPGADAENSRGIHSLGFDHLLYRVKCETGAVADIFRLSYDRIDIEGRRDGIHLSVRLKRVEHVGQILGARDLFILFKIRSEIFENALGNIALDRHHTGEHEDIGRAARSNICVESGQSLSAGFPVELGVIDNADPDILILLVKGKYLFADLIIEVVAAESDRLAVRERLRIHFRQDLHDRSTGEIGYNNGQSAVIHLRNAGHRRNVQVGINKIQYLHGAGAVKVHAVYAACAGKKKLIGLSGKYARHTCLCGNRIMAGELSGVKIHQVKLLTAASIVENGDRAIREHIRSCAAQFFRIADRADKGTVLSAVEIQSEGSAHQYAVFAAGNGIDVEISIRILRRLHGGAPELLPVRSDACQRVGRASLFIRHVFNFFHIGDCQLIFRIGC